MFGPRTPAAIILAPDPATQQARLLWIGAALP